MLYSFSASPTQHKATFRNTNRLRRQFEKTQGRLVNKAMQKEVDACIRAIHNASSYNHAVLASDTAISNNDNNKLKTISNLWVDVGTRFYQETLQAFEKSYPCMELKAPARRGGVRGSRTYFNSDPWLSAVLDYIEDEGAMLIANINETSRKKVRQKIMMGQLHGDSLQDIAKELDHIVKPQYKNRSMAIARTETCASSNKAGQVACKNTGFETEKSWYSSPDSITRDQHSEMDSGHYIDIGDLFVVGGEFMEYPGDNTHGASAENIINCRCAQLFRLKKGA